MVTQITQWIILALIFCSASFSHGAEEPPTKEIIRAISDLGHEQYAAREEANQRLLKLAATSHKTVLTECLRVYRQTNDPEVKSRLKDTMETVVDRYLFRTPKGYLGVTLNRVNVIGNGRLVIQDRVMPSGSVWVTRVMEDTGAQKAGLQPNDFIITVDGKQWESGPDGFIEYVQSKHPGERLKLSVLRETKTNTSEVVLGELPQAEHERLYTKERSQAFFERWLDEALKQQK